MDPEDLRLAIYGAFATTGRAPGIDDLADDFGVDRPAVVAGLEALAAARHVVLDDDHRVVMAHPFASIPLGFSVMGATTLWWGGCAWDSFAIPHLVPEEPEALVATRCPACGRPHAWAVDRQRPPDGDQVTHFLVPVAQIWDDVVHSCRHQRIFCDRGCVAAWLEATGHHEGSILDLPTLWRLAARWYEGRLDRGYRRREPAEAKEYFAGVGLGGPFWGLA